MARISDKCAKARRSLRPLRTKLAAPSMVAMVVVVAGAMSVRADPPESPESHGARSSATRLPSHPAGHSASSARSSKPTANATRGDETQSTSDVAPDARRSSAGAPADPQRLIRLARRQIAGATKADPTQENTQRDSDRPGSSRSSNDRHAQAHVAAEASPRGAGGVPPGRPAASEGRNAPLAAPRAAGRDSETAGEGASAGRPLFDGPRLPEADGASAEKRQGGLGWAWTTCGALALVIGLIFLCRNLLARVTGQPSGAAWRGAVESLGRVPVGPRQHVLLLKVGSRVLVVANTGGEMRTLATVDDPEEVADLLTKITASKPQSASAGFSQLLARFNSQYDPVDDPETGRDVSEYGVDRARDQLTSLLSRVRRAGIREGGV